MRRFVPHISLNWSIFSEFRMLQSICEGTYVLRKFTQNPVGTVRLGLGTSKQFPQVFVRLFHLKYLFKNLAALWVLCCLGIKTVDQDP